MDVTEEHAARAVQLVEGVYDTLALAFEGFTQAEVHEVWKVLYAQGRPQNDKDERPEQYREIWVRHGAMDLLVGLGGERI